MAVINKQKQKEKILSPTQLMIQKFKANSLAMFGLWTFLSIIAVVIIGSIYVKVTNYNLADLTRIKTHQYLPPSFENLFGTDRYGRDYFLRVIVGGAISLQVAVLATLLSTVIGVTIGAIAGYCGGKVDMFLMRVAEIVSSFPFLALAITISVMFVDYPAKARLFIMIFIMGILRWTGLARMVRGQILSLREQEFITATKALGISSKRQITRHLIPNVIAYIIVSATIAFAAAILTEASLSFLGLSVNEPVPTWGGLLQRASTSSVMKNYPWLWQFPGTLLFMLIMSINLVGEGLRDAVDPKSEVMSKSRKGRKLKKQERERIFAEKELAHKTIAEKAAGTEVKS